MIMLATMLLSSCNIDKTKGQTDLSGKAESEINIQTESSKMEKLEIKIGEKAFMAILYDTPSAQAFSEMLPMTVTMQELNGNEKYYYLPKSLPTDAKEIGTIKKGDIMLWQDNCLAMFYKTFSTSYHYTKIGHIENPDVLFENVYDSNITVAFELVK